MRTFLLLIVLITMTTALATVVPPPPSNNFSTSFTLRGDGNRIEKYRIIFLSFFATKSHQILYEPLLERLAERGHDLTIVSPVPYFGGKKGLKNVHQIDVSQIKKGDKKGAQVVPNMFQTKESKMAEYLQIFFTPFVFISDTVAKVCEDSFELPEIQKLVGEKNKVKFDLIIFPSVLNECLYGLVHALQAPHIVMSQFSIFPWMALSMGSPVQTSFVPNIATSFTHNMNFGQRLLNFFSFYTSQWYIEYIHYPRMEKIYRKHIHRNLPSIGQIEANASLVLCNSHTSFTSTRPLTQDIIDVGGMHMKKTVDELPKELKDFVSQSGDDGFIIFSMGTALKASDMPTKYRKIFLKSFTKLRQRVIWIWEIGNDEMMTRDPDFPSNVLLTQWIPQNDLLAQGNCRLFITHGGHASAQEAIFYGVPILGIPMLIDQLHNMELAQELGLGIKLEFTELTEEIFGDALSAVIFNSSYRETAKRLSGLFHDQIDDPLERAVYWTEYVVRHQGATHLRSAARKLNGVQYYSLDVMATLALIFAASIFMNFVIVKMILKKCFLGKTKHQSANEEGNLKRKFGSKKELARSKKRQ